MTKYVFGKPLNALVHGGDYNPEQWLDSPEILKKDIEYMKEAGINEASIGIFSWAMYEPREGEFHFEWIKEIMDNLYANGIYTILATPSAARPYWLDNKYPDVMRTDSMGVRNRHGLRHNHCLTSENYRNKVRIIDGKLASLLGDHPGLIMWHISNEFGGECYCDACKKKFQEYLRNRFDGDIEKLNHEWWTTFWSARYTDFDQIEPPYKNGQTAVMGLNLEWKRFTTANFSDFMSVEIDAIRSNSRNKDIPITTNFMKRFWDIDYREFGKQLDAISWDDYPYFHNDEETYSETMFDSAFDHAILRGLKKDRPFLLMESAPGQVNWHEYNKLKRPNVHQQFALQAIASGSDSVQYFQWRKSRGATEQYHGAVIDHIGTNDTRVFKEVKKTGEMLSALSSVEGSLKKSEVGIIFEWDNWWAIEGSGGFANETKKYDETVKSYWIKLMELGVEADIISVRDDLSQYKFVIAPMLYSVREETSEALKEYVNNGGILLGTYMSGYVNENCLCYLGGFPGAGLKDLYGVIAEEIDTFYPSDRNSVSFSINNLLVKNAEVKDYAEILRVGKAKVLGTYNEDFYEGKAALTYNEYGRGKAFYQACRMNMDDFAGFLDALLKLAEVTVNKVPAGIEYHERQSESSIFKFYLNVSDSPIELSKVTGINMLTGEACNGDICLKPLENLVVELKK